ncbi:hypothetical protein EJB05_10009, partial [Eragrostis curvula]
MERMKQICTLILKNVLDAKTVVAALAFAGLHHHCEALGDSCVWFMPSAGGFEGAKPSLKQDMALWHTESTVRKMRNMAIGQFSSSVGGEKEHEVVGPVCWSAKASVVATVFPSTSHKLDAHRMLSHISFNLSTPYRSAASRSCRTPLYTLDLFCRLHIIKATYVQLIRVDVLKKTNVAVKITIICMDNKIPEASNTLGHIDNTTIARQVQMFQIGKGHKLFYECFGYVAQLKGHSSSVAWLAPTRAVGG